MNGEKFKPTIEWMKRKYDEMNTLLFNGELGACSFYILTSGKGSQGHTLGQFKCGNKGIKAQRRNMHMYRYDMFGGVIYLNRDNFVELFNPMIGLNGHYSATEGAWLNTLVHEMCHYYTYMNGYAPRQGHGVEFRNAAAMVSRRSNGAFTITRVASAEKMENFKLDDDMQAKIDAREARMIKDAVVIITTFLDSTKMCMTKDKSFIRRQVDRAKEVNNRVMNGFLGLNYRMNRIYVCTDPNKIDELIKLGYKSMSRTFPMPYWNIKGKEWENDLLRNCECVYDSEEDFETRRKEIEARRRGIVKDCVDRVIKNLLRESF